MSDDNPLRAQNWERITAQLTTFAWKRTKQRSWDYAQELAQEAIAQAFEHLDAWNPEKETLLKHLARRVIGLASNDWTRKRNSFEVALDLAPEALEVEGGEEGLDDEVDGRRVAQAFRARLAERLEGDEAAAMVVAQMAHGVDTVAAQARATGLSAAAVREARRRIFYHSEKASLEIARELDLDETDEVAQ